jgi:anaerobic magnesium-protoporphyrin IX monomethyl ester cyclase
MITLVNCQYPAQTAAAPPGVLSLAASIRAAGIEVSVLDLQLLADLSQVTPEDLLAKLGDPPPPVVGLSTMSNMLPFALESARLLKQAHPQVTIVIGGCGVQGIFQEILERFEDVDFLFQGEGDVAFPHFLKTFLAGGEWQLLPGIAFRAGSKVQINPPPPRIQDLDLLPLPAYDLVDINAYTAPLNLMTARGCPFHCVYCSGGAFRGTAPVARSHSGLIEEIELLAARYRKEKFSFVDDTFTVPRGRAASFCRTYREKGSRFSWSILARINTLTLEDLDLMAQSGCKALYFGIESGSERVLSRIKKGFTLKDAETTLRQAKERFEFVVASLMYGFPFETVADLEQTLVLAGYCQMLNIGKQLHFWSPMPLSSLYEQYREQLVYDPEIYSNAVKSKLDLSRYEPLIASDSRVFAPFYHVPHPGLKEKIELARSMGFWG